MLIGTQHVMIQPSCDQKSTLQGDVAEEEFKTAQLVSSHTLPHQNTCAGKRGRQMAHSRLLSRHTREM